MIFIVFIVLVAVGLILKTKVKKRVIAKKSGKTGESLVAKALEGKRGVTLLNDIILKDGDKYCQIDHVLVTDYGVYVIETKNHKGLVVGDRDNVYWQVFYGKKGYKLYNPIKQNETHIKRLEKVIGNQRIDSIVIFTDSRCQIGNKIEGVYKLDEFKTNYTRIIKARGLKINRREIVKDIQASDLSSNPYHRFKQVKYAKGAAK